MQGLYRRWIAPPAVGPAAAHRSMVINCIAENVKRKTQNLRVPSAPGAILRHAKTQSRTRRRICICIARFSFRHRFALSRQTRTLRNKEPVGLRQMRSASACVRYADSDRAAGGGIRTESVRGQTHSKRCPGGGYLIVVVAQ